MSLLLESQPLPFTVFNHSLEKEQEQEQEQKTKEPDEPEENKNGFQPFFCRTGSEYLTQQETILINLLNFYKDETALLKVLKIINGKSKISLRIIDWFVTNFAKQYFTRYNLYRCKLGLKEIKLTRYKFKPM